MSERKITRRPYNCEIGETVELVEDPSGKVWSISGQCSTGREIFYSVGECKKYNCPYNTDSPSRVQSNEFLNT